MPSHMNVSQSQEGVRKVQVGDPRTRKQWCQLLLAYLVFYTFIAGFMAMVMAVYVAQSYDTGCATPTNGDNVCVTNGKFSDLRKKAINAFESSIEATCMGNTTCTATLGLRINKDYHLNELDGTIGVTCFQVTSANILSQREGYTTNLTFVSCAVPQDEYDVVVTQGNGVLDNRNCSMSTVFSQNSTDLYQLTGESKELEISFHAGAKTPYSMDFDVAVKNQDIPFDAPLYVKCEVTTNDNSVHIDHTEIYYTVNYPF
eukprot:m.2657 g.2657  ORF g.2657 m.2657 type:complete len:258 (-) comp1868_c0_seq1:193-966(-)